MQSVKKIEMDEIADLIEQSSSFVDQYKAFAQSLCVQRYLASTQTPKELYEQAESTWPSHCNQQRLAAPPRYFKNTNENLLLKGTMDALITEGQQWLAKYQHDVDRVLNYRQEHIHPKDKTGKPSPLTACQNTICDLQS